MGNPVTDLRDSIRAVPDEVVRQIAQMIGSTATEPMTGLGDDLPAFDWPTNEMPEMAGLAEPMEVGPTTFPDSFSEPMDFQTTGLPDSVAEPIDMGPLPPSITMEPPEWPTSPSTTTQASFADRPEFPSGEQADEASTLLSRPEVIAQAEDDQRPFMGPEAEKTDPMDRWWEDETPIKASEEEETFARGQGEGDTSILESIDASLKELVVAMKDSRDKGGSQQRQTSFGRTEQPERNGGDWFDVFKNPRRKPRRMLGEED